MNKLTISLMAISLVIVAGSVVWFKSNNEPNVLVSENKKLEVYELKSASSTVYVSGVVAAFDSAIVSAKTNGVLNSLAVVEGKSVTAGTLVATQDTPVQNSQVAYQSALQRQLIAEQAAAVDVRKYAAEKASVLARSAEEIAVIKTEGSETQLRTEVGFVRTATEAGVTTMLDTLAFVHDNPALFSDTRREQFNKIVTDLYGNLPNHFSVPIAYGVDVTSTDTLDTLEAMRSLDTDSLSILDTETLGVVVMGQLRALVTLYTTAEQDVLDSDVVTLGDSTYTAYFNNRANIIEALSNLETAEKTLQSSINTLSETVATNGQAVEVTNIDEELSQRQSVFSQNIAAAAEEAAAAATGVAIAEASLSQTYTPFSGVVSTIYAEVGEYVRAGEPLFALHGNNARELAVSIPAGVGTQVKVGDSFLKDDEVVGVVDRLSPTQQGHSVEVFITLFDPYIAVGTSFSGEIEFNTRGLSFVLPRQYVFFSTDGPSVRTEQGRDYPVRITLDNGDFLTISFVNNKPVEPLVPSRSVSF